MWARQVLTGATSNRYNLTVIPLSSSCYTKYGGKAGAYADLLEHEVTPTWKQVQRMLRWDGRRLHGTARQALNGLSSDSSM